MRFTIKQNTPLTSCVYRMTLQGDTSAITAPGQFVQVQVPGFYLRRPISVCPTLRTLPMMVSQAPVLTAPDFWR